MNTPTPSQIETNAAKRPNGLRACAIGILKNPDVVIASVIMNHAADKMEQLETELNAVTEQRDAITLRLGRTQERMFDAERQRDMLAEAVNAATILIAAKGRYNTMLAYKGLRKALQSLTNHNKL